MSLDHDGMNGRVEPRHLEDLVNRMTDLVVDVEYKVLGHWCRNCRSTELVFVMKSDPRDEALDPLLPKGAVAAWPHLRCKKCGLELRGRSSWSF